MTQSLVSERDRCDQPDRSTRRWRTPAHSVSAACFTILFLALAGCGGQTVAKPPPPVPPAPPAPQSVLLFGGLGVTSGGGSTYLGDTWSWTEAGGWTEMHPSAAPSARFGAMAARSATDVILFGGVAENDKGSGGQNAETWSWDGTDWTQQMPSSSPPPLTSSLLVPLEDNLVLFGGYREGELYEDVWRWDAATWSHLSPSTTPSARQSPAGAVVNGSLVVFGGEDVDFLPIADTWVFDGTSWTQMHPAHSPSPRRGASAAAYNGTLVLFGGDTISPTTSDWLSVSETWVWDGTDWTEMSPSHSPDPRSSAGMAAAGDRLVLFGGSTFGGNYGQPAGTWTWDGTDWSKGTGPDPAPRNYPTLTSR